MISSQYLKAEHYLNEGLIRTTVPDVPKKLTRQEWMLRFLDDLGHPEQTFPAIHIAGTSGKGSTAVMIAEILRASGLKVGLHTTPYLQVQTEKLWYDGKYATAEEFVDLVEWIRPICEKWRGPEVPLHGMASFGICLEYFRRKKVDVAVIETGVGGRDDLTNVLNTKLSVITPLGLDHTVTLGNSIESIAQHKAGIIKPNIPVVAFKGPGHEIITSEAKEKNAPLHYWAPQNQTGQMGPAPKCPHMPGKFQGSNGAVAMMAAKTIKPIYTSEVEMGLKRARLPGRMEALQEKPRVVIDGAHNFQKLSNLFEEFSVKRPTVVFGILGSKVSPDIIDLLMNFDSRLILTSPKVYGKEPADIDQLSKMFKEKRHLVIKDPKEALGEAIKNTPTDRTILVTGSLYLAGNVREYFYPSQKILEGRSSWPK